MEWQRETKDRQIIWRISGRLAEPPVVPRPPEPEPGYKRTSVDFTLPPDGKAILCQIEDTQIEVTNG